MSNKPWTEEDEILLEITMNEKDLSYSEIAKATGRTIASVRNKAYKIRRGNGFKSNRWTEKDIERLKILTANGIGNEEIGKIMGRTTNAVINKKYKSNIRARKKILLYKKAIEEMAKIGLTCPQIAKKIGMTRKDVYDFCRHYKITVVKAQKGSSWRND